jgi:hypothetical protein
MILAIDPGNIESGYALIDRYTYRPLDIGKISNTSLIDKLSIGQFSDVDIVSIEMIGHYGTGMPAGKTVFDTCIWIGRFIEVLSPERPTLIKRATVKAHICGSVRAKDANVTQALVDRFAAGVPNHGKGSKANPGWFYGFRADIWQAFALAVYTADTHA